MEGLRNPMTLSDVIGKRIAYAKKLELLAGGTPSGNGVYLASTNEIGVSTNGTEKIRVNAAGEVGVGLNPVGGIKIAASDGTVNVAVGYPSVNQAYVGTTSNHPLILITNNSTKARVEANGDFGIGMPATSKLHVNGDITVSSATTANTATAGAQTLPANPVGFLVVSINGASRKIPYYAT